MMVQRGPGATETRGAGMPQKLTPIRRKVLAIPAIGLAIGLPNGNTVQLTTVIPACAGMTVAVDTLSERHFLPNGMFQATHEMPRDRRHESFRYRAAGGALSTVSAPAT
jgi:hypothetical protein